MGGVVGVRLVKAGKIHYFNPGDAQLDVNGYVVLETDQGLEMGWVVIAPSQVVMSKIKGELPPIVRMATPEDLQSRDRLKAQAQEALTECRQHARDLKLDMKALDAYFTLDGARLVISYASEEKGETRDLLRLLGQGRSLRIEFRQVGPRDETKILGGLGRCGRELCCATWLTEFQPISMKMAKEQDLPLSPPGLAGVCGRLRCCLRYEYEMYRELKKGLPRIGARVTTPGGVGVVVVGHPLKQTITIRLEETGAWTEVPMADVQPAGAQSGPPPSRERREQE